LQQQNQSAGTPYLSHQPKIELMWAVNYFAVCLYCISCTFGLSLVLAKYFVISTNMP
jgi:hypothetical protein